MFISCRRNFDPSPQLPTVLGHVRAAPGCIARAQQEGEEARECDLLATLPPCLNDRGLTDSWGRGAGAAGILNTLPRSLDYVRVYLYANT